MTQSRFVRRGEPSTGSAVKVDVTPHNAGWGWSGLRVIELAPGDAMSFDSQGNEMIVLPLSGSFVVHCGPDEHELTGRESVFSAVSDFCYVGRDRSAMVSS